MDSTATRNPPHMSAFSSHHSPHEHSLPPLSVLTSEAHRRGSVHQGHPNSMIDTRDSGNWSQTQSKHSSTISSCPGVPIQSILNSDAPTSNGHLPPIHRTYTGGDDDSFRSHRSSIDSRVNYGMGHLAINPPSPTTLSHMAHQNGSRASLASSLAQQRGIVSENFPPQPPVFPRLDPTSPGRMVPRRAPVIHPNPRSVSGMPDPTAAAPTPGYAWAFPDKDSPPERRRSSSADSFGEPTSSVPGSAHDRSPSAMRSKDHGVGTYSRTPELRVSHKMAERKRRSEMKQLFEELHSILPHGPNTKSSKWEILAKAIEYIKHLRCADNNQQRRTDHQHRVDLNRIHQLEEENMHLRRELQATRQHLDPANRAASYSSLATTIGHDGPHHPAHPMSSTHSLPPPMPNHHQGPPGQWGRPISAAGSAHSIPPPPVPQSPNAMTGIEYSYNR